MSQNYTLPTVEQMHKLAQCVAKTSRIGQLITLRGQLGAGKTSFAQGFINALCSPPVHVTSPTFNIVQPYETSAGTVWHYDLYRLKQPEELFDLGLEEALETGIALLEWPEKADSLLPTADINISIKIIDNNRQLTILADKTTLNSIQKLWQDA